MGLMASIVAAGKTPNRHCAVRGMSLSKKDAAELSEVMDDWAYSTAQIHRGLLAAGHTIGLTAVKKHRAGECSCVGR